VEGVDEGGLVAVVAVGVVVFLQDWVNSKEPAIAAAASSPAPLRNCRREIKADDPGVSLF
jgi:hypothetical protein